MGIEERLRLLIDTGLLLSSERNLDVVVQAALDAGLALCGAAHGAFVYRDQQSDGEPSQRYRIAGADSLHTPTSPMPRFAASLNGDAIHRADDITADASDGQNIPWGGLPPGECPVRSYLRVPVRSRAGEILGVLLYGHPERGVFRAETESLVATIASQAAVAIESIRLTERLTREVAVGEAARAEQRSAERRLRQALDAVDLGTWIWNADSGLIDFDERAAELFCVQPHVPISRQRLWQEKVIEDDRKESPEDLRTVLEAGQTYAAEYRIQLEDGSLRWIAASGIQTMDETSGQVIGMTGTVQDISVRKNQEESLRQSEKLAATGRLAATIAHEINNPLEAVTNLIYLAKTDPSTPVGVERMLETADNELARVSQIAQQTLGFYRDTTKPVSIDLNELLGAVVDLFDRKLAVKRLQVTLDLEPGLMITGLQGEIRQVVSNLLVNAIDASPGGGASIRIRGQHRHRSGKDGVSVMIADGGSGIPSHVQGRLFTPFVTTKASRGTGLGLWVTRGMVEKQGGTIRFRSRTATPSGTVFRVYLPQSGTQDASGSTSTPVLQ